MIVAGVTGGIGSGKTTLCKVWEELGAVVVYADDLAKELMVSDAGVKQKITETFGMRSFHSDGSLNKPYLIEEAFKKGRVEELNRIVHPAVSDAFREICAIAKEKGEKLVVKEAALLLQKGRSDELDVVVLVTAPESEQLKRVTKRDSVSEEEVLDRLKKQSDFEKLKSYADYTVHNDGTVEELKKKSKNLFEKIVEEKLQ